MCIKRKWSKIKYNPIKITIHKLYFVSSQTHSNAGQDFSVCSGLIINLHFMPSNVNHNQPYEYIWNRPANQAVSQPASQKTFIHPQTYNPISWTWWCAARKVADVAQNLGWLVWAFVRYRFVRLYISPEPHAGVLEGTEKNDSVPPPPTPDSTTTSLSISMVHDWIDDVGLEYK